MQKIINSLQQKHPRYIDLSLDRIYRLLEELGNPHLKIPPVIHIAGTNGKGSTIAFLRAILEDRGYKVHIYTSPHLVKYNERIVLSGNEISDEYLYELLEKVDKASDKCPVTLFEAITAAAFLAFSEVEADITILETGLGGRLDATNVMPNPLLTAITPISTDHEQYLGNTIEKIAGEKFGIVKPKTPCVISYQDDEIPLPSSDDFFIYGRDYKIKNDKYISDSLEIPLNNLSLIGEYQKINAATALACIDCISSFQKPNFKQSSDCIVNLSYLESYNKLKQDSSFRWNDGVFYENISNGLKNAKWKARMEQIAPNVWLDGGHNEAAAEVISNHIKESWNDKTNILVIGMLKNKSLPNYLKHFTCVDMIYGVPIPEHECYSPDEIVQTANKLNINALPCQDWQMALKEIESKYPSKNILICGSLYLAGEVLKKINNTLT